MLLLLWSLVAHAAGGRCTPLYELEMKELIDAQYKVLLDDEIPDVAEHDRMSRELEARIPCADFLITKEIWGRYLVSVSLREFFRHGDWSKPLTTALRIDPDLDLPVREGHPLRDFKPADAPPPTGDVPADFQLYLDGERVFKVVPLDAEHLLQRPYADGYQTAIITGPTEIPKDFLSKAKDPKIVRDARRKRIAHIIGTTTGGVLLVGGGVAWGLGHADYVKFRDPQTDPKELQGLIDRGKPLTKAGIALSSVGAGGLVATWAIPW